MDGIQKLRTTYLVLMQSRFSGRKSFVFYNIVHGVILLHELEHFTPSFK